MKLYKFIIKELYKHKSIAIILSHGGLHFCVLLLCIVVAFYMYGEMQRYNLRTFRQFSMRIEGDTLKNYRLSHVSLHFINNVESNRTDSSQPNIDGIMYLFKYKDRVDSSKQIKTFKCNKEPYVGYDIDLTQLVTLTLDTSFYVSGHDESAMRKQIAESFDLTSKFHYNTNISSIKQVIYHCFTSEDTIKQDMSFLFLPNLIKKWQGDNPYFCCFYGIHAVEGSYDLSDTSELSIQYNFYPYNDNESPLGHNVDMFSYPPSVIETVLPEPTELTIENIIYKGKDVEKVFEQGGVYVTAVDPIKKAQADRMQFLWTVLIGTVIAFALEIVVQLILKWRKLRIDGKL